MDILIADPDPNILSGYLDILGHREDVTPTPVQDGFEAADMLVNGPFEAAVLDFRLLHRDGIECVREVRLRRKGIPIVMTTSVPLVASGHAGEFSRLDVSEVLWKPVDIVSLLHALSRALSGLAPHQALSDRLAEEAEAFQRQQLSSRMGTKVHVLSKRGRYQDAISEAKRLRSLVEYQFGQDSLDFAVATKDLGGLYLAAGLNEMAVRLFSEAAAIRQRVHLRKLN